MVIDGIDGSGKSTLAKQISDILGIVHINLDLYLEKNRGGFVDYIDYTSVQKVIEQTNVPIIVEGVCALAVMRKLGIKQDLLVYMKRLSSWGYWKDDHLNINGEINAFIANQNLEHQKFSKLDAELGGDAYNPEDCTIPKLTEEIYRYHHKFRPQDMADIIYEQR